MNDIYNGVLLRSDIHLVFDASDFAFSPKQGRWVVHVIGKPDDTPRFYHNRGLHGEEGVHVRPEFMYARFALAIFSRLGSFFQTPSEEEEASVEEEEEEEEEEELPRKGKGKSKEAAPKVSTSRLSTTNKRPKKHASEHPPGYSVEWEPDIPFDELSDKAEYLLDTEHPAEIWQTLYPPVGCMLPSRLVAAVKRKMKERNMPRQYWDRTWKPEDEDQGGEIECEGITVDDKMDEEGGASERERDRVRSWQQGVSEYDDL
jgi:hypothetical protein